MVICHRVQDHTSPVYVYQTVLGYPQSKIITVTMYIIYIVRKP